jgi:hypothetical protein
MSSLRSDSRPAPYSQRSYIGSVGKKGCRATEPDSVAALLLPLSPLAGDPPRLVPILHVTASITRGLSFFSRSLMRHFPCAYLQSVYISPVPAG